MAVAAGMGVKLKGFVREEAFTHCMGEGAVDTRGVVHVTNIRSHCVHTLHGRGAQTTPWVSM